jgi:hypothetical protein
MSQREFANTLGVPVPTLRNWDQNRVAMKPATIALMRILAREPEAALRALGPPRRVIGTARTPSPARGIGPTDCNHCMSLDPGLAGLQLIVIAGRQVVQGVTHLTDHAVPVAGGGLTKLSQGRVPRTVVAVQQPAPASIKAV